MITFGIAAVLVITALAFYLFIEDKISIDATAILILVLLIVTKILTPAEGISGFSNPATITVLCMFILSAGIQKTGAIQALGNRIFQFTNKSLSKQLLAISAIGPISGFINNTATVAILIPMIMKLAEKTKVFASKLLIPLSYISMAAGTLTIIGTSTNILANDVFTRLGFEAIGIFDITKLGIIVLVTTVLYFLIIGRFLLPERKYAADVEDPHKKLEYSTEVVLPEKSHLLSQQVRKSDLKLKYNIEVRQIRRGKKVIKRDVGKSRIYLWDVLLVRGKREDLLGAEKAGLIKIKASTEFLDKKGKEHKLVQFMVAAGSSLIRRTVSSSHFRRRYGAVVLGLRRGNEVIRKSINKVRLKFGDIILMKGTGKAVDRLKRSQQFVFISEVPEAFRKEKTFHALAIMALVVLLAAFNVFPIMVAALIGVTLMVFLKVIKLEEGYRAVNWKIILLLAGIIPLGIAIEKTGTAELIAGLIISASKSVHPLILLGIFYLITTLMTEIISNNATVVVIVPIAVSVANQLGLNPIAFVIAVMFAASTSFLTPIGYQTNTMVYSAGNYKFKDFARVGALLNIILLVVSTYFISVFWGL